MKVLFSLVLVANTSPVLAHNSEQLPASCTEAVGEQFGRDGYVYEGGCPPEMERDFLSGYVVGKRVYAAHVLRDRARREYQEAIWAASAAIDDHAAKAAEAIVKINDPDSSEGIISAAKKALETHRRQILAIEEEARWTNERSWDAKFHYDQIRDELDEWKKGEAHSDLLDLFVESHTFARMEEAVEYCSDTPNTAFFGPDNYCLLKDGGVLKDVVTGRVCVTGPARAGLVRRGNWDAGMRPSAAFSHSFNVGTRAENGKKEWSGFVVALFDEAGGYIGARCPGREE